MIKLKDILLEKEKPFGDILFGDKEDPVGLRGLQGTMQPEKDTKQESELYDRLQSWYIGSYTGFDSYGEKLLSLKKDYPRILDPMEYGSAERAILYRVGKVGIHFMDIMKHLNQYANKIVIKPVIGSDPAFNRLGAILTLQAPYEYKVEGKKATSWGLNNPERLRMAFAYGNQIIYATTLKKNTKYAVMNPMASEIITTDVGNSGNENEVILLSNLIKVDKIEIPMSILRGIPNTFSFGDREHFNDSCSYNAIANPELNDLSTVLTKFINRYDLWVQSK
jgi:hypothetical protein